MKELGQIIREARTAKGFSRRQLSERSKVSERQIRRLETEKNASKSPRENTLQRLSKALGLTREQLVGEEPLPDLEPSMRSGSPKRQTNIRLSGEARNAYQIIDMKYGVTRSALIEAAPLLFTLLAESCFVWRKKRLADLESHISSALSADTSSLAETGLLRAEEACTEEQQSIDKCELFGRDMYDYSLSYDLWSDNPFAKYLGSMAKEIGKPETIEISGIVGSLEFVEAMLFSKIYRDVAMDDEELLPWVTSGDVSIEEFFENFEAMKDPKTRRAWIEEQINDAKAQQSPQGQKLLDSWLQEKES